MSESNDDRILLNRDHLIFCQFLFEDQLPNRPQNKSLEDKYHNLFVYVYNRATPFKLRVKPDTSLLENATDWETTQLQSVIMSVELNEKTNVFMITDKEGDISFFKIRDVSLMKIPLENIEIALVENKNYNGALRNS